MSEKILVIGPSWVGDMVMAQSLFKLLKAEQPLATLEVLAPAWTFSLLNRMPEVSRAIAMPFGHGELKLKARFQFAKTLRDHAYTQAIVLPNSFKSALIPWFAKIPKRTGWLGEARYFLLNDYRRLDKARYPLMIDQYLALGLPEGQSLPAIKPYPAFQSSDASEQAILQKLGIQLSGRPILALCPGGEFGPSKRWPEEYFAQIANWKLMEDWDVWIFGSIKDRLITEKIMTLTQNRCIDLSGRTELTETIDLLSLVTQVLTNDSGLMHIASALQKPLVALYGSTSPHFTPPLSEKAHIAKLTLDCQPCFKRTCPLNHHACMRDLTPAQVLLALNARSQ